MRPESLVVVHGASGTQGRPVSAALLAAGHRVRGVARHPDRAAAARGVEVAAADLADAGSLAAAYQGADAVVVTLPGPAAPDDVAVRQADAVLAALSGAGVARVIFNASGALWDSPVGVPFLDARIRLAHGLSEVAERATVLVPSTRYMENLEEPWVLDALRTARILEQAGDPETKIAWLALEDLAATVRDLLANPEPPARATIAGPEALTGHQVLASLGQALNAELTWRSVSFEDYNAHVREHLGAQYAAGMAALYGAASNVGPPATIDGPHITATTTLTAWANTRNWAHAHKARTARTSIAE